MQVGDVDQMKMLFAQIGNQARKIRESFGIDGEGAILVLVVDVEVDHVGRNSVGAKTVGDFSNLRFGRVAVTRLLETESPQRRQRRRSGEIGVGLDNLFGRGAVEKVIVERSAFGAEGIHIARLLAKVKPRAPGVVEKNPVTMSAVDGEEKRNALVKRVGGFLRADVGVPESEGLLAAIEGSGFVAEAEIVLVAGHFAGNGEAPELKLHGAAHGIGGDDFSGEIANNDAERIALHANLKRGGAEADGGGVVDWLHVDGLGPRLGQNGPGSVLGQIAVGRNAHADDVVAKRGDAKNRGGRLQFNAVVQRMGAGNGFERNDRW